MTVILPQATAGQIGMTGTDRTGAAGALPAARTERRRHQWVRRTSIERYVAPLGLAVVMPQVHRSFYTDEAHGNRYWTFLSEELPRWSRLLPGVPAPGGHLRRRPVDGRLRRDEVGAARTGPVRGCRQHVRSRGSDPLQQIEELRSDVADRVFGDGRSPERRTTCSGCWNASNRLPRRRCRSVAAPAMNSSPEIVDSPTPCGTRGSEAVTDFGPGEHDWAYWDARIQSILAWLPLHTAEADQS